jgi:hypothetical protein
MLISSRNMIDVSLYDLSEIFAIGYCNCYCDSFSNSSCLFVRKFSELIFGSRNSDYSVFQDDPGKRRTILRDHTDLDSQGVHLRNGKHNSFTVWGPCAKYPVQGSSVTIHVTPRVGLSGSPERNWIDIHDPQCSRHDQVILRTCRGYSKLDHNSNTCFSDLA